MSHRELEILTAVAAGFGDKEIARDMCRSKSTIKAHLRAIYRKLGARNRVQAAALAIETGLIARPLGRTIVLALEIAGNDPLRDATGGPL